MNVTPIEAAPQYHPPEHFDMRCLRLQGMEAGPSDTLWMGLSEIAPGGHTRSRRLPYEKLYLVVEGEVVVGTEEQEAGAAQARQLPHRCRRGAGAAQPRFHARAHRSVPCRWRGKRHDCKGAETQPFWGFRTSLAGLQSFAQCLTIFVKQQNRYDWHHGNTKNRRNTRLNLLRILLL